MMKDSAKVKAVRIYELVTAIILIIVLIACMLLAILRDIGITVNSAFILLFLIPILAKFKIVEVLEDVEKNLLKEGK